MSIQTVFSVLGYTFYAAKEILTFTAQESANIALAFKDLVDNGIDSKERANLASLSQRVKTGYQSLPDLGINALPLSIASYFSRPKQRHPSYDLQAHFRRVRNKGHPLGGYSKPATPPPKPRKSLLQMMQKAAPLPRVASHYPRSLNPFTEDTVPPPLPPKPGRVSQPSLSPSPREETPPPLPPKPKKKTSEDKVKATFFRQVLLRPMTAAEKHIYGLGNQLYKLGIFGRDSWKDFLSYTYEQQSLFLEAAKEYLPNQGLGEKLDETRDALMHLGAALYASKDDRRDVLKKEIQEILNGFVETEFMEQEDVTNFLRLNVANQLIAINEGICRIREDSEFANQARPLIHLAQKIHELHQKDMTNSSKEQLEKEIKILLKEIDKAGIITNLTTKGFSKLRFDQKIQEFEDAILQLPQLPEHKHLIPGAKRAKKLITELQILNSLIELEKMGILFEDGETPFRRRSLEEKMEAILQKKIEVSDPFCEQFEKLDELQIAVQLFHALY